MVQVYYVMTFSHEIVESGAGSGYTVSAMFLGEEICASTEIGRVS
jgi:hypothetical protein